VNKEGMRTLSFLKKETRYDAFVYRKKKRRKKKNED